MEKESLPKKISVIWRPNKGLANLFLEGTGGTFNCAAYGGYLVTHKQKGVRDPKINYCRSLENKTIREILDIYPGAKIELKVRFPKETIKF